MHLQLITLTGVSLDQDIYELMAPTTAGDIAVFPGHEPLVTMAAPGALAVRVAKGDKNEKLQYFAISGGIIEITPTDVRVLVDEADAGEDIAEAESKAALDRALKLRDNATTQVEIEKALEQINRQQVRLRVAELQRRHHR
ncbi:MAG: ATP synthase F1 subunit epsilon [Patescibacteria group bacterium]